MAVHIRGALAALLVLGCATSLARADDKDQIKESIKKLAVALNGGDAPTAKKYVVSDESSQKTIETLANLVHSNRALQDAAVAKFGDAGKTIGSGPGSASAPQFDKDLDESQITVSGDTATVAGKNGTQGRTAPFKKEDGTWKLDIASMPQVSRMSQNAEMFDKMATAMNETAGEIKDGKYSSVQEAKQALGQKIVAIFRSSGGLGGAGAPPHG